VANRLPSSDLVARLASSCRSGLLVTSATFGAARIPLARLIDEWAPAVARFFPGAREHPHAIMISFPHGPELLAAVIAAWKSGNAIVPVSTRATRAELRKLIDVLQPARVACAIADLRFENACSGLRPTSSVHGLKILAREARCQETLVAGDAWLATTSGTTGEPKNAVISASAILTNAECARQYLDLTQADRVLLFTPTHFAYAIVQLLSAVLADATVLAWPHGLLSPHNLADFAREHRMTGVSANPTAFEMWLRSEPREQPGVRYLLSAGQPFRAGLFDSLSRAFPGAICHSGYGCTENTNRITITRIDRSGPFRNSIASVGWPIPGTTVRLEPDTAEIVIGGSSLMQGYLADLQSGSARVVHHNTGDLGSIGDAGELYLIGRIRTRMNVGNEKVDPETVEAAIALVPGVCECAVVPLHDDLLGDAIGALIVLETTTSADELRRDIRPVLAAALRRSQWPHHIATASSSEIPRTSYGKIDRVALKKHLQERFGAAGSRLRKTTEL